SSWRAASKARPWATRCAKRIRPCRKRSCARRTRTSSGGRARTAPSPCPRSSCSSRAPGSSPATAGEPFAVGGVVHDADHDDEALAAVAHDGVEQPPEIGEVLHVEVLDLEALAQRFRHARLLHDLAVEAIGKKDAPKRASAFGDGGAVLVLASLQRREVRLRVPGQDDVLRAQARQRRSPLRIASRIGAEAAGTQMRPLLPSAMLPSCARKPRAALRLCLVVECPHSASRSRSALRLTGPPAERSALRMYSSVARVGLAPGRANRGWGGFAWRGMGYT